MDTEELTKKLSPLEKFYQLKSKDLITKLTDKEKDLYSKIAFIISLFWLTISLFGILLGLIWFALASAIIFKFIHIGLNSNKKWMSISSIVLYIINASYYILVILFMYYGNI